MASENIVITRNPNEFAKKLFQLQKRKMLCDATLVTDGERIAVHGNVLAASSEYFENVFVDSNLNEIILNDVDKNGLQTLIEYCYTGTIETTADETEDLVTIAHMLSITTFIESSAEILEKRLSVDNCLSIWRIAQSANLKKLELKAFNYFKKYIVQISHIQKFLNLEYSEIYKLLTELGSKCSDSVPTIDIYNALKNWINYDNTSRMINFVDLIDLVELTSLPHNFLLSESLFQCPSNSFCLTKFVKASLLQKNYELNDGRIDYTLVAVGSKDSEVSKTFEILDADGQEWIVINDIDYDEIKFSSIYLDDALILIGGYPGKNKVVRYDLKTGKKEDLSSLNHGRYQLLTVKFKNCIYAIGGRKDREFVPYVEMWNSTVKTWSKKTSMNIGREGCGGDVLKNEIIVVGGYDGKEKIDTVEAYDPSNDIWRTCRPMLEKRWYPGVVTVDNYLYVVGGSGEKSLNTIERYDANIDQWTHVDQTLSFARGALGAVLFNNKLIIGGGYASATHVEILDLENAESETMPSFKQNRVMFNLLKIPKILFQDVLSRKT